MNTNVKDKYQNKNPESAVNAMAPQNTPLMVETPRDLAQAIHCLEGSACIALDMEADSMFHFKEKICLIQISNGHHMYLIDTLAIQDITPLAALLADGRIRKILHGADYDIRSFHRDFGLRFENVFDTELAARFLGYSETGLEALLKQKFNVILNKKFQKKDWSKRPLPPDMIAYAADDVRYLIALHEILLKELTEKNRLDWILEENDLLLRVKDQDLAPGPLFTRVKGAGRLDPTGLAVLESLLKFRLKIAAQKDRPPFKIIGTPALLKISREKPASWHQLQHLHMLSEKQLAAYGKTILDIVCHCVHLPKSQLPRYPRKTYVSAENTLPEKIKKLKQWRTRKARILGLDPGILLNNSAIKSLAEKNPKTLYDLQEIEEIKN